MDVNKLDELYAQYRFKTLPVSNENVRVYSYTSRYFSNADIVKLTVDVEKTDIDNIEKEVSQYGFSTTVRNYKTVEEAEISLFDGFFDITTSQKIVRASYEDYKEKVSGIIMGPYQYVKSEFYDAQIEAYRTDSVIERIVADFSGQGPLLVVLEAAAGFGKTSTAYEVLNRLIEENSNKIPLFTELSRNRQATIFKYVLYDEIDRKFTGLHLDLVLKHIKEGRIPMIIDGFDELIKSAKSDSFDNPYENAEPMLETIRELLQNDAKILLTTRKTAIFDGDEFHSWLQRHSQEFSFQRYALSTPIVGEWISPTREKIMERAGLNIKSISNPVLLSYIRSMDDETFEKSVEDIDTIINDYIQKLLSREKIRQELLIGEQDQEKILEEISYHFINKDITSDTKEAIEKLLFENLHDKLIEVLSRYPADKKIKMDQLLSKLTMHAFLDRKNENNQRIGFVNDFILGTFIGKNLQKNAGDLIPSERFVDYVVSAYTPRNETTKRRIYELLNDDIISLLPKPKQIFIDNYLYGSINHDIENEFIENIEFKNNLSTEKRIHNSIFSQCDFRDVEFNFSRISDTHFINCNFYNCTIKRSDILNSRLTINNCNGLTIEEDIEFESAHTDNQQFDLYERKVLERFWPAGKERFAPNKMKTTLRLGVPSDEITHIDEAIDSLIRREIIIEEKGKISLSLNIQHISEIKKILGR